MAKLCFLQKCIVLHVRRILIWAVATRTLAARGVVLLDIAILRCCSDKIGTNFSLAQNAGVPRKSAASQINDLDRSSASRLHP